ADGMDRRQGLVLEAAYEALEDAGQAPSRLAGTNTGVFVGVYNADYMFLLLEDPERIDGHCATGMTNSVAAGRLSYTWNLQGPSVAVDTACSSSLVAVHLA